MPVIREEKTRRNTGNEIIFLTVKPALLLSVVQKFQTLFRQVGLPFHILFQLGYLGNLWFRQKIKKTKTNPSKITCVGWTCA